MKKILMALALLFAFGVPALAQEKASGEKKEAAKEEKKTEVDYLKPYRTKGNTWTWKSVSKVSGYESVAYTKYEVTEVTEEKATCKVSTLDKDKKELASTTTEIPLKATKTETPKDGTPAPEVKTSEEKIKVEAGEIDCIKTEMDSNGTKTTSWTCKATGLLVKSQSSASWGESTMELVEMSVK
ncbi:MAG: hypothetical protein HPKKFMNG_02708 [Planctomycetes bacterium]|nr:hypothetical protein [Planctomycetota bacterium]